MLDIQPITLEGQTVQLQPMTLEHWEPLWAVGADESLWRWTPYFIQSAEEMRAYVETALRAQEQGTAGCRQRLTGKEWTKSLKRGKDDNAQ